MTKISIFLFALCLVLINTRAAAPNNFVVSSCKATLYPTVCLKALSPQASQIGQDPLALAKAALVASQGKTVAANKFIAGVKPPGPALKDCIEQTSDGLDMIKQSMGEMDKLKAGIGNDFMLHKSNIQTWVSAALSDLSSCTDGLDETKVNPNIKAQVKSLVDEAQQLISNTLSFVNKLN